MLQIVDHVLNLRASDLGHKTDVMGRYVVLGDSPELVNLFEVSIARVENIIV